MTNKPTETVSRSSNAAASRLRVEQADPGTLLIERLPDGSTAIFDRRTRTMHSLNASAAAAFEACRDHHTVDALAQAMGERLHAEVTPGVALAAIGELEKAGLAVCSGQEAAGGRATRRGLLSTAAAVALPAILTLTAGEQKAFARDAGSGTTTTTTTTVAPTPSIVSTTPTTTVCTGPSATDSHVFTVTGANTHFVQGTTVVTIPTTAFLTVDSVTVTSSTTLTMTISGFSNTTGVTGSIWFRYTTDTEVINSFSFNPGGYVTVTVCGAG
jgi:hypothetical protein